MGCLTQGIRRGTAVAIISNLHLVVVGAVLTSVTSAAAQAVSTSQSGPTQSPNTTTTRVAPADVGDSHYSIEEAVRQKQTEAIPVLEHKFDSMQDIRYKDHIASALVRLGVTDPKYWNFLVDQAAESADSDAPGYWSIDANGKTHSGPTAAFQSWAKARNLSLDDATEQELVIMPSSITFLGLTGDKRAIPVLRRGLSSSNHLVQASAAEALAALGDKESVPLIIDACKRAPADVSPGIARYLVYFDDPEAQHAFDKFVSPDDARIEREARAKGKRPYDN